MAVSRKLLTEGEQVVLSVRTHVKALLMAALVLVLTCAAAGFLYAIAPEGDTGRYLRIAVLVVASLVILLWTVLPFIRWMTSTYTVTNRRLIAQTGILTRSGRVIPLQRINDVSFEKKLSDRMLGCGTLIVHDASEQGGLTLPDVPRVEEVHRTITDLVFSGQDGSDDDGTFRGARGATGRCAPDYGRPPLAQGSPAPVLLAQGTPVRKRDRSGLGLRPLLHRPEDVAGVGPEAERRTEHEADHVCREVVRERTGEPEHVVRHRQACQGDRHAHGVESEEDEVLPRHPGPLPVPPGPVPVAEIGGDCRQRHGDGLRSERFVLEQAGFARVAQQVEGDDVDDISDRTDGGEAGQLAGQPTPAGHGQGDTRRLPARRWVGASIP